jgi:hypothetical protein
MRVVTALREPEAGSSSFGGGLCFLCVAFFVLNTFVKQRYSVSASLIASVMSVFAVMEQDNEQATRMGICTELTPR